MPKSVVTVRLPDNVLEALNNAVELHKRPRTDIIVEALRDWLALPLGEQVIPPPKLSQAEAAAVAENEEVERLQRERLDSLGLMNCYNLYCVQQTAAITPFERGIRDEARRIMAERGSCKSIDSPESPYPPCDHVRTQPAPVASRTPES